MTGMEPRVVIGWRARALPRLQFPVPECASSERTEEIQRRDWRAGSREEGLPEHIGDPWALRQGHTAHLKSEASEALGKGKPTVNSPPFWVGGVMSCGKCLPDRGPASFSFFTA